MVNQAYIDLTFSVPSKLCYRNKLSNCLSLERLMMLTINTLICHTRLYTRPWSEGWLCYSRSNILFWLVTYPWFLSTTEAVTYPPLHHPDFLLISKQTPNNLLGLGSSMQTFQLITAFFVSFLHNTLILSSLLQPFSHRYGTSVKHF